MARTYTPRPGWVDAAKPGDVLLGPSGDMRVIRKVTAGKHWRHPIFSFAIRRCSWTRRPYTVYTWGELVRTGYTALGASVSLDGRADKKLARNLYHDAPRTVYCWDVCGGQMP